MDIEKLIEAVRLCGSTPKVDQCKRCAYWAAGDMSKCIPRMTTDAATALSTLQAENEKLRNEVERQRRSADDRKHLYENAERAYMKVVAELEEVKRERDAAVKDLEKLCRDDVGPCEMAICELCAYNNGAQCSRNDSQICDGYDIFNWKWRGPQKED